jgi:hypothetical protein
MKKILSLRGFFLPELLLAEKPWQSHNGVIIDYLRLEIAPHFVCTLKARGVPEWGNTCKQEEKQGVQVSQ